MRTVTEKTATAAAPNTSHSPMRHELLLMADAKEIIYVLDELFISYAWQCTNRLEEDHETIMAVYLGLKHYIQHLEPETN